MKELTRKAKDIISKIIYITIATCSKDGNPWNTPVYAAYDENYNFYWISWKDSQHSKNIKENSSIFIVIYDSTVPEGTGEGVYIQATAYELTDETEIKQAAAYIYSRTGQDPEKRKPQEFLGEYPRRIYKTVPEKCWINTNGEINGNYVDKRTEVDLLK